MRYWLLVLLVFWPFSVGAQAETVYINALVTGCGNGIVEVGESCDTGNLNGQTCQTLGFGSGVLSCSSACTFNTLSCVAPVPDSGRTSTRVTPSTVTPGVVLTGFTIPRARVTILADGVRVASGVANEAGAFSVSFAARNQGLYRLQLFVESQSGLRATSFIIPYVAQLGTTKFENLFVAPTINVTYTAFQSDTPVRILGESSPGATIVSVLYQNGRSIRYSTTTTTSTGAYESIIDTIGLLPGTYTVLSFSQQAGRVSAPSRIVQLEIGSSFPISRERTDSSGCLYLRGDLNRDCRVNLLDANLVLEWSRSNMTPSLIEAERLSGDGTIDRRDFSIIMAYWTG